MKKLVALIVLVMFMVGCSSTPKEEKPPVEETSKLSEIKVYTRDSSSGTREAFESIIGLEKISDKVAEASSNGDMATKVGSTEGAIGYVSMSTDFEANKIKALSYQGIAPSITSVNDGSYELARPFSYVTRAQGDFDSEDKEALVAAFIDYLVNSKEGRQVVLSQGAVTDVDAGQPWSELKKNHPIVDQDNSGITIKTAGSTSVEKTLSAAIQAFIPLAGNFSYEPNQTGSSDGYKRVLGDEKDSATAADIGFASRSFKTEEDVSKGMLHGEYAKDAVVVVVGKDNPLANITPTNLVDIYSGTITQWSDVKE